MIIRNPHQYKILKPFADVTLPGLTVVVGPNGVGKSALLEGISAGAIGTDLFQNEPGSNDCLLIKNGPLPDTFLRQADPAQPLPDPNHDLHRLESHRNVLLLPFRQKILNLLGPGTEEQVAQLGEPWRGGVDALIKALSITDPDRIAGLKSIFEEAEAAFDGTGPGVPPHMTMAFDIRPGVRAMAARLGKSRLAIEEAEYRLFDNATAVFERFAPRVAEMVEGYRRKIMENMDREIEDKYSGKSTAFPQDRLYSALGTPPWATLSAIIQAFGLNYSVKAPEIVRNPPPYTLALVRSDNGAELSADGLSAGEQVLLRFALALFDYDEATYNTRLPKLLLFDELDASLHPAMLEQWIRAIKDELVAARGAHCILTTHSPITAALVPDDALYELTEGVAGLHRIEKQKALNRLLVGVPALAIDYSNRRQVIVESNADAEIYQDLQAHLKPRLNLPRSLDFIAAGKSGSGDAGCGAVINLVEAAADSGNVSMFGLVDWDGHRQPTTRVLVFGTGERYAIENGILDPLMIGAYLIMKYGAIGDVSIEPHQLGDLDGAGKQALANAVQGAITYNRNATSERTRVSYVGGFQLDVQRAYLERNGHDLEQALTAAFAPLEITAQGGAGRLMKIVVRQVIPRFPGFCPSAVANILTELSGRDLPS